MKHTIRISLSTILLVFTSSVMANINVGVIDLQKVILESEEAKTLNASLEKKFKPRQEKILDSQESLKKKLNELERNSAVMTQNQITKLQEETVRLKRDVQREAEDLRQDLSMAQEASMKKFTKRVQEEVEKIAKAKKLDLVLQKAAVAYSSDRLDITKQLIEKLS